MRDFPILSHFWLEQNAMEKRKMEEIFKKKKTQEERHKVEERPRGENIIQTESFYLDLWEKFRIGLKDDWSLTGRYLTVLEYGFFFFLNLKHCISFSKHQNESATGIHVLSILNWNIDLNMF